MTAGRAIGPRRLAGGLMLLALALFLWCADGALLGAGGSATWRYHPSSSFVSADRPAPPLVSRSPAEKTGFVDGAAMLALCAAPLIRLLLGRRPVDQTGFRRVGQLPRASERAPPIPLPA
jgi:hypothetical protein